VLRRCLTATAPLAALALALTACGGSSGPAKSTEKSSGGGEEDHTVSKTIAGRTVNFTEAKDVRGMASIEVEADDYYFKPSVLTGTPGQKLAVTVANESSSTEHNFMLTSQHIDKDIEAGADSTFSVTIPASGVLSFFCEYHAAKGLAGGVAVTGANLAKAATKPKTGKKKGSGSTGGGTSGTSGGYGY
jgi:plastocyanin